VPGRLSSSLLNLSESDGKSVDMPGAEHERLIAFLQSPLSYPYRPREVRLLQTHISWVFIASPFVFKVKKPVNLGFLDFSTLERRHHFCRRELELNRRLCPDAYLAVMPIHESEAGFSFEANDGEIVEYALKMRELSPEGFLSELLVKGAVGEPEINRVISRLHSFYESQAPTAEIEQWGTPEKLMISTDENFAQVEPFVGKTISPVAFETIRRFTSNFYLTNERLFRARIEERWIRDCHGDLHLDHIHLTPEATTIFDCIEFNDRFRFIDIANDLAFLAMDFDFEGERELARLLFRTAAREFRDSEMLKLADFYKCYRAVVRGKVESIQAASQDAAKGELHAERALRYFRLALRYATSDSRPLPLVIMGPTGSGKSTVARQLATELDWPLFSSDQVRKTLAGVPLTKRTEPELRAKIYSDEMTEETYRKLVEEALAVLTDHAGVVIDATFSRPFQRELLRDKCRKAGVPLQVVELEANRETIRHRLKAREKSTSEISDARLDDFEKLSGAYEPPAELASDLIRISTGGSLPGVVKAVLLRLAEKQSSAKTVH
jgi:uncharacterized protein